MDVNCPLQRFVILSDNRPKRLGEAQEGRNVSAG